MCNATKINIAINKGREVWKVIKHMENPSDGKQNALNQLVLEEEGIFFDSQKISEELNKYLAGIGELNIGIVREALDLYL